MTMDQETENGIQKKDVCNIYSVFWLLNSDFCF
jgi:hypothetical protein